MPDKKEYLQQELYNKAFPVEVKNDKEIKKVHKPSLTQYIKEMHPHIKIFGELRKYEDGYYRKWDCMPDIYEEMPKELRDFRDAAIVTENLKLEKDSIKLEKDLARNEERYIPFKNCIYDLETKKLLPHSPDKIFLNQIPYNYEEAPECCEVTEIFLNSICGKDKKLRKLLLQIIGVVMSDIRSNKSWFYFYGKDTGKSTILKIIRELLTDKDGTIQLYKFRFKVLKMIVAIKN